MADSVLRRILLENQISAVYPTDADSISIPIFSSIIGLILILILNVVGLFLAGIKCIRWLGVGLTISTIIFTLEAVVSWISPNHNWIAVAHLPLLLTTIFTSFQSYFIATNHE